MGIDKDKEKYMEILDSLTDALGRSDEQSTEEVMSDIRDEGIDIDATLERLKKARLNISMAAKRSALDAAKDKRLKLIEKGHSFIGRFGDWTREQVVERIKELSGPEAGLAYRDLEEMGKEEMFSILEDLELAHRSSMEENGDSE